jgi:very-short-patch-repair endonuclease
MATNNPGCLTSLLRFFGWSKKKSSKMSRQTLPADEPESFPYLLRDDFLSGAETSFYHVLNTIVSNHLVICPKVSLGDIFYVSRPDINVSYYNKINRKHVDFLLCNPKSLKPMMAIELDDSSHGKPTRIERDQFVDEVFETAGLPLVHIPVRQSYQTQEINDLLKAALQGKSNLQAAGKPVAADPQSPDSTVPLCPKCGIPMVLRTARRGDNIGGRFYGCANYPKCKEIIPFSRGQTQ